MRSCALLLCLLVALPAAAQEFTYRPPGELVAGSGSGLADLTVHAPGMRYPIESAPSFANSQVWGRGGSQGGGGSQCDAQNFSYPWHDNYCESRSWSMPLCPSSTGHQGQDIRAASCQKGVHHVVSVEAGKVTSIGSYSVYITTPEGVRFDYLHMNNVAVSVGQQVQKGQRIGTVSNEFGGSSTTVHLHFNIFMNVQGVGMVYVSPYMSLVEAYEDLVGTAPSPPDAGVADAKITPPKPDAGGVIPGVPDASMAMLDDPTTVSGGCAVGGSGGSPLAVLVLLCWLRGRSPAPQRRQQR